jgi:hypothetical protein
MLATYCVAEPQSSEATKHASDDGTCSDVMYIHDHGYQLSKAGHKKAESKPAAETNPLLEPI